LPPGVARGCGIGQSAETVPETPQPQSRSHLLGLGLDGTDGHRRITKAERFSIVGGSAETHERMTETVVKTFEVLDRKGKDLDRVDPRELAELLHRNQPRQ